MIFFWKDFGTFMWAKVEQKRLQSFSEALYLG